MKKTSKKERIIKESPISRKKKEKATLFSNNCFICKILLKNKIFPNRIEKIYSYFIMNWLFLLFQISMLYSY